MSADYEARHARRDAAANPVPVSDEINSTVANTLSAAFAADPVMDWFLRDDAGRDVARRMLIDLVLPQYCERGWAVAAEDGSCATLWGKPGVGASPSIFQQLRMMPRLWRMCTRRRLGRVFKVMGALEKNHPKKPNHYYLFMIGVNPIFQGQGLGSSILDATLSKVDVEGMPAYLENSNPKNTPLYERHGFKTIQEIKFEPDGPSLWPMWREAKA